MIEADGVDRIESRQIVAPGREIAVPCDDVERRVIEGGRPEAPPKLLDHLEGLVAILEPGDRRLEVARVGETVGAD